MTAPLVFVSTHRVPQGAADDLRALGREFVRFVEAEEPHSVVLQVLLGAEGTELTYLHVHDDAQGMDRHLRLSRERIGRAVDLAPPVRVTVYGTPGPVLSEALRHNAEAGARVTVVPEVVAGLLRSVAA